MVNGYFLSQKKKHDIIELFLAVKFYESEFTGKTY